MDDDITSEGFVPFWRNTRKTRVFANERTLKVWLWCKTKASHIKRWIPISTGKGLTEVKLLPGQFLYGREKAAIELNLNPTTVRYHMQKLQRMNKIRIKPCHHYSIVTVCDYNEYVFRHQQPSQASCQATDRQLTGKCQAIDTNNNVNNVNKDKNVKRETVSNEGMQLAKLLFDQIKIRDRNRKEPDFEQWASEIDLLISEDGRTPKEIENALRWCREDSDFWWKAITNPQQLRKHFDTISMQMSGNTTHDGKDTSQRFRTEQYNLSNKPLVWDLVSGIRSGDERHEKAGISTLRTLVPILTQAEIEKIVARIKQIEGDHSDYRSNLAEIVGSVIAQRDPNALTNASYSCVTTVTTQY